MPLTRIIHWRVLPAATLVALMAPSANVSSQSQQVPGVPPGLTVVLTAALSGFSDQRPDTRPRVSNIQFMEPGEFRGLEVYAMDAARCLTGAWNDFGPKPEAAVSWGIEGRVVSVDRDMVTLDLHWQRRVASTGFDPATAMDQHQRVTLRDGHSRPFDLVRTGEAGPDACQWFVAEYGVDLLDPPEVEHAVLQYVIWLVHRERDGREVTRRFQKNGEQGEVVNYEFPRLFHTSDGVPLSTEREGALATILFGEIKGRVRLDGLIDLTIDTVRTVKSEQGNTSSNGRKLLTVKPGETVEVQIPPPTGQHTFSVPGRTTVLDHDRAFAGQSTAFRITATRVR